MKISVTAINAWGGLSTRAAAFRAAAFFSASIATLFLIMIVRMTSQPLLLHNPDDDDHNCDNDMMKMKMTTRKMMMFVWTKSPADSSPASIWIAGTSTATNVVSRRIFSWSQEYKY